MRTAVASPHAIVRIGALSHTDPGGDRLRGELRRLLEDAGPSQRLAALVDIEKYQIKAATSVLALRVRSPAFDELPLDEKRRTLAALGVLAPPRAEAIAIALLEDQRIISPETHETTRQLACELLGQIGTSEGARATLDSAAKSRWRSSERVRATATRALATFDARAAAPRG
jgi:hypothetical protein